MKGLLITVGEQVSSNHKIDKLMEEVQVSKDIPEDIKTTLQRHLDSNSLLESMRSFINQNNVSFSRLYEYLRYLLNKRVS